MPFCSSSWALRIREHHALPLGCCYPADSFLCRAQVFMPFICDKVGAVRPDERIRDEKKKNEEKIDCDTKLSRGGHEVS